MAGNFDCDRRALLQRGSTLILASHIALSSTRSDAAEAEHRPPEWTSENRFLQGAFAPVFDERDDINLQIEGQWPKGLDGAFMRNGPNPEFAPDAHYGYPFDGTGMIHAVFIQDGRARYRNRWVRTKELMEERAAGRRLYNSTFSAPPHANLANTNIIHHAGRYLALYEGGAPYVVDGNLNTVGPFDFGGRLPGSLSAHPKVDPTTHELLSIEYDLRTGDMLYTRASAAGVLDRAMPFRAPWPAMIHDIAITERHVVAFFCPLVFDFSRKGPPAEWEPERGTMIALVPRDAKAAEQVKWIKGPPFFNWHTVNAFEQGERIEVVFPWYDSFSLTAPAKGLALHRVVINSATGAVEDHPLDDQACEFGRINEAYLGRKARYGYVGLRDPRPGERQQAGAFEAIARYDLATGDKVVHRFPAGATICEPVFVADPHGRREVDGFVLTFVHDAESTQGSFVVLDARNLDAEPVARIVLPRRVPAGLHGSWVSS
jgi:carotenoid cleavage dioxygenase